VEGSWFVSLFPSPPWPRRANLIRKVVFPPPADLPSGVSFEHYPPRLLPSPSNRGLPSLLWEGPSMDPTVTVVEIFPPLCSFLAIFFQGTFFFRVLRLTLRPPPFPTEHEPLAPISPISHIRGPPPFLVPLRGVFAALFQARFFFFPQFRFFFPPDPFPPLFSTSSQRELTLAGRFFWAVHSLFPSFPQRFDFTPFSARFLSGSFSREDTPF